MKEKITLISFSNNYNYSVMGCMSLLGTAQLLKPWKQTGHHHPHHRLHTVLHNEYKPYLIFITAMTKNPALQRYDVIKRNVAQSNVETLNYLELLVSTTSRGCQVSLKTFKISQGAPLSWLWCSVASWHTVWESWT